MADINLPIHSMPFIGRDDEIPAIAQRLADPTCHLLTLVGPGGIGKTRLAIEVAKTMAQRQDFADGVYFVDLQPVTSGDLLVMAIAKAMGILFSGAEVPRTQLLGYLSGSNSLLILDNFEQLLDSIDLLADIVKIAPGVKMLVTSREALNIQEEWAWRVGGLQVPQGDSEKGQFITLTPSPSPFPQGLPLVAGRGENAPEAESMRAYSKASQTSTNIESFSAVQLFVERAGRARQDFTWIGQEAHIAHICRLVEGMPLALELAAGWTKALSCAEIVEEIQRSLNFLTTTKRNMPERHRSMQAIFDHSWRLLSDEERAVFPKLSVFRGGFRREAAEDVSGASLGVLAGLVDKSFLRVSAAGRYSVHELMRQYGAERLDDEAKREAQNRHCVYYAGFLHQRQLLLRGPEIARTLDEIGDELDNIRASWEFAVEHDMRDAIHQSMHSFFVFCHIRAQAVEGERLFDIAVQRFEHEDSATLAYLLLARTWQASNNGKIVGIEQFSRALHLVYTFWTEDLISMQIWESNSLRSELLSNKIFNFEQYEAVCRDYLEIFRQHDQRWGAAWMLFCLGDILLERGSVDEAENMFRESEAQFLQIGDRWASCWASMGLAQLFEKTAQYQKADQVWQRHQDIIVEVGDWGGTATVPCRRADIARKQKNYRASRFYIVQAIESFLDVGSTLGLVSDVVYSLVDLYMSEDRHERAAEMASFLHQRADEALSAQTAREARQVLDSLAQKLPPDIYQQAVERGKSLRLRNILEQLQNELAAYSPLSPAAQLDALTERELEVLRLVAAGRSNREIALDLVLSLNTVKSHIHHVYGKLGVESRVQAVTRARELRLL